MTDTMGFAFPNCEIILLDGEDIITRSGCDTYELRDLIPLD